ncbi:MAG: NADPH-dependent FMN reductase [Lactobacillus sp.]|nr:NADPH-dependent FMN reductase [Lactobacillus sp.]
MKISIIVGTNADKSYNRMLAEYITSLNLADFEKVEIDLPLFGESEADGRVAEFRNKLKASDGVIVTTPEYNKAVTPALKNAFEWLDGALIMKPTAVIGTSLGIQGATRAQEDAREILLSPEVSALVFPGHEVLIGQAPQKFIDGTIDDENTRLDVVKFAESFVNFVKQYSGKD